MLASMCHVMGRARARISRAPSRFLRLNCPSDGREVSGTRQAAENAGILGGRGGHGIWFGGGREGFVASSGRRRRVKLALPRG